MRIIMADVLADFAIDYVKKYLEFSESAEGKKQDANYENLKMDSRDFEEQFVRQLFEIVNKINPYKPIAIVARIMGISKRKVELILKK